MRRKLRVLEYLRLLLACLTAIFAFLHWLKTEDRRDMQPHLKEAADIALNIARH